VVQIITALKQLFQILFFVFIVNFCASAQLNDSNLVKRDSIAQNKIAKAATNIAINKLLADNLYLNSKSKPVSLVENFKRHSDQSIFFYLLAGLVLLLGITKTLYSRYFSNMFRVFFNSSLRQSQLTDQLIQDKLPSLIFNIFFVLVGGIFVYLLINYFNLKSNQLNWKLLGICVGTFVIIYFVKFITLKFTGWITGFTAETDIYTFIIFLINKIIAICLLPMIIIMAFSSQQIVYVVMLISIIIVGAMLLMRLFRSYGLLQHRIKVSRFHFLLYVFSLEILPLLLIYKGAMFFFSLKS
jgi:hypothetical protein